MIPISIPYLPGNEEAYLRDCVRTNFVSSVGPYVDKFERGIEAATGARHAVATSAGTTGLHAALTAVGVKPSDLVIQPSYTFIASANAVSHAGATPWLFDVDPRGLDLDPTLLAETLAAECCRDGTDTRHVATGRRIAAIMPVHAFGRPANMDAISTVAKSYGLPVVSDAAAAIGATSKGRPLGALVGDLGVLSFNGNKTITCGGGGAIIGNDDVLMRRVRHLTTTARVGGDYDHDEVGFNYRMTNLQAAVGCAQLENLSSFLARRRAVQVRYSDAAANVPGLAAPDSGDGGACWLSYLVADDDATAEALRASLRAVGVEQRLFWKPVHLQAPYAAAPRTRQSGCDSIWRRIVVLPSSNGITDDEIETVAGVIAAYGKRSRAGVRA